MQCDKCNGEKKIPIYWEDMRHSHISNEQAERLAGEVHHYEECDRCYGTGELHRYLFIMSGIGSCSEEAFDNCDFEAEVGDVTVKKGSGEIQFVPEENESDLCTAYWPREGEILKDEMEE